MVTSTVVISKFSNQQLDLTDGDPAGAWLDILNMSVLSGGDDPYNTIPCYLDFSFVFGFYNPGGDPQVPLFQIATNSFGASSNISYSIPWVVDNAGDPFTTTKQEDQSLNTQIALDARIGGFQPMTVTGKGVVFNYTGSFNITAQMAFQDAPAPGQDFRLLPGGFIRVTYI